MAVTPFTINSRQVNAGSNIYLDPHTDQPFQLPANLVQIVVNLDAQSWNTQTPTNHVRYAVERLSEDGTTWVEWGAVNTEEGVRMPISKGGGIGSITLYGTGQAEQARINITVDQDVRPGVSASGTVTTV
jgi:hypothetical protein